MFLRSARGDTTSNCHLTKSAAHITSSALFFLTTTSSNFMDFSLALTAFAAPLMENTAPVTLCASPFMGSATLLLPFATSATHLTASVSPLISSPFPLRALASPLIGSATLLAATAAHLRPLYFPLTASAVHFTRIIYCSSHICIFLLDSYSLLYLKTSILLLTNSAYSLMTFTSLFVAFALYHALCLLLPFSWSFLLLSQLCCSFKT
jgi:hypothetical protein